MTLKGDYKRYSLVLNLNLSVELERGRRFDGLCFDADSDAHGVGHAVINGVKCWCTRAIHAKGNCDAQQASYGQVFVVELGGQLTMYDVDWWYWASKASSGGWRRMASMDGWRPKSQEGVDVEVSLVESAHRCSLPDRQQDTSCFR